MRSQIALEIDVPKLWVPKFDVVDQGNNNKKIEWKDLLYLSQFNGLRKKGDDFLKRPRQPPTDLKSFNYSAALHSIVALNLSSTY